MILSYLLVVNPNERKCVKQILSLSHIAKLVIELKKRNLALCRGRSRSLCRNLFKNVETKRTASENRSVLMLDNVEAVYADSITSKSKVDTVEGKGKKERDYKKKDRGETPPLMNNLIQGTYIFYFDVIDRSFRRQFCLF